MLYPAELPGRGLHCTRVKPGESSWPALLIPGSIQFLISRMNTSGTNINAILKQTRTIAVVGLSQTTSKASYEVASYLMSYYEVIPVNPKYDQVLGRHCYPDLQSIPWPVDMVDLFQRSENILRFVQPAIDIGVKYFWMQLGIGHPLARSRLEAAGIEVVEDKCTKVEHLHLRSA